MLNLIKKPLAIKPEAKKQAGFWGKGDQPVVNAICGTLPA